MNYKVPLMRPSLPNRDEFVKVIYDLWETKMLSNFSKYSKLFEEDSKKYFNSDREFLSVSSCDIGLTLILKSFDFPAGSEVLVPSFTFNSTVNSIMWNNLNPVFVDINPETFNMEWDEFSQKITDKTVAIMGVHIFGNPSRVEDLEIIAKHNKLKLIFDSAHAYGSKFKGKHICEYGDAGAYSFSGTKVITSGEGGLVYFKDKEYAEKFRLLRQYGFINDYNTKFLGLNGKISEMHSALAQLSIKDIDAIIERRIRVAKRYESELKNCIFQKVESGDTSTHKDFAILVENRDKLSDDLDEAGIQTKKYFFPNHYTDYYKEKYGSVSLPQTEDVFKKILCLPIFNDITDEQVDYVIKKVNKFNV